MQRCHLLHRARSLALSLAGVSEPVPHQLPYPVRVSQGAVVLMWARVWASVVARWLSVTMLRDRLVSARRQAATQMCWVGILPDLNPNVPLRPARHCRDLPTAVLRCAGHCVPTMRQLAVQVSDLGAFGHKSHPECGNPRPKRVGRPGVPVLFVRAFHKPRPSMCRHVHSADWL
jgi:hypothetical protein